MYRAGAGRMADPRTGTLLDWVCNGHSCVLYTRQELPGGTIIRTKDPDFIPGTIRDPGRDKAAL